MRDAKVVLIDNGLPVELAESSNQFSYTLLPLGKFYDKRYGKLDITEKLVKDLVDNFGKVPSYDVPVKLGHGDGAPSPGKVTKVEATKEGLKIFMDVDAETAKAIRDKKYRYMSAEFVSDYVDKTTGEKVGPVLIGAALVNQPANPYTAPLVLADDVDPTGDNPGQNLNRGGNNMTLEEMEKLCKESQAEAAKAKAELAEAKKTFDEGKAADKAAADKTAKELADLKAEFKKLADEKAKAEKAKREADVKAFADSWKAKGVPPAALDKLTPYLLNEGNIIKLSETDEKPTPLMTLLGDLLEAMPKVPMGQVGSSDTSNINLSEADAARKLGEDIAKSIA